MSPSPVTSRHSRRPDPLQLWAERNNPPRIRSVWYCDRTECDGLPHDGYLKHARTEQRPPPGEWLVWCYMGGRGTGKTRSGAQWTIEQIRSGASRRFALVGRTPADVRQVMIEGESGIMACSPADFRPEYHSTKREIEWPNGAVAYTYSAEAPDQLRGPQHDKAWIDESSAWTDAPLGDALDTSFNNLMLSMRQLGGDPRCMATMTPKPNLLTREILAKPTTVLTRGTTYDNLHNLSATFAAQVLSAYEGTRIGRQELMAEMLDDIEGALWTLALIDAHRVAAAPELSRVVVSIDPSGTGKVGSDEAGIIVSGKGAADGHGYVLADRSAVATPARWGARAIAAYHEFHADLIVAETNYGGDMVVDTIHHIDPTVPVKALTASRGKRQRAEPVSALYEQGRYHHVGSFKDLEDELTVWTPESGSSPGRLDALVWGAFALQIAGSQGDAFEEAWRRMAKGAEPSQVRRSTACHHFWKGGRCMYCGVSVATIAIGR